MSVSALTFCRLHVAAKQQRQLHLLPRYPAHVVALA